MSARLLARTTDGVLQEFALGGAIRIGSDAASDVVLDAPGVLPQHAQTAIDGQGIWIEPIGEAKLAVNGEPAARRMLRHLDVITFGDQTHVIFSTSAAPLPQPIRSRRAAVSTAPPANVTRVIPRAALAAMFKLDEPAPQPVLPNTAIGITPAAAVFTPPDETTVTAPINVAETVVMQPSATRPIRGVRLSGNIGDFEAPIGRSVLGRGQQAAIRILDKQISREHAAIVVAADRVTIEDLKSVNGTKVNGAKIDAVHVLAEGDLLTFGSIELRMDFLRLGGDR
jgi:pSer/pThr/pTyr-binding forkhead associated (FHA) protein